MRFFFLVIVLFLPLFAVWEGVGRHACFLFACACFLHANGSLDHSVAGELINQNRMWCVNIGIHTCFFGPSLVLITTAAKTVEFAQESMRSVFHPSFCRQRYEGALQKKCRTLFFGRAHDQTFPKKLFRFLFGIGNVPPREKTSSAKRSHAGVNSARFTV